MIAGCDRREGLEGGLEFVEGCRGVEGLGVVRCLYRWARST